MYELGGGIPVSKGLEDDVVELELVACPLEADAMVADDVSAGGVPMVALPPPPPPSLG